MLTRLRLIAFAVCLPAAIGAWLLVDGDFDVAMAVLLLPALAAGVVLSSRFYPLQLSSSQTERMNAAWKRTMADIGWISVAYLVVLMLSAVATQVVDPDASAFPVNALIAVLAGAAALLGVLGGFITILPIVTLARSGGRLVTRRPVDAEETAAAVLLLSVGVFATSLVLATNIDTGGSPRGEAWTAIFVLITGLQSDDARIVSEPLAWVARAALLAIVASIVVLARASARRKQQTA